MGHLARAELCTIDYDKTLQKWVHDLSFSTVDSQKIAIAMSEEHVKTPVRIWDIAKEATIFDYYKPGDDNSSISHLAPSPVHSSLIASGTSLFPIVLWDSNTGQTISQLNNQSYIWDLKFSPDGKWLAISIGVSLVIWDLRAQASLGTFGRHMDIITGVAFSPDGQRLASCSQDKKVVLQDLNRLRPAPSSAKARTD